MKVIIDEIDTCSYDINIEYCTCPEDLTIVQLIGQTIDKHYDYMRNHHGKMATTITELIQDINN